MHHMIASDTLFVMAFIDFGKSGDISDHDVSCIILTCLDFMKIFGIVAASVLKKIHQTRSHDGLL